MPASGRLPMGHLRPYSCSGTPILGVACMMVITASNGHTSILFGKNLDLLKALHVGIGAIRECMIKCYRGLGTWLRSVLEPVPISELPSEQTRLQFYQLLGAPADIIAELVSEMCLWWDPEKNQLKVASHFLAMDDSIMKISALLIQLWRPQSFTASRWATIGASCRSVALSVSTGLLSLLQHLQNSGVISDYESQGTTMIKAEQVLFCFSIAWCPTFQSPLLKPFSGTTDSYAMGSKFWRTPWQNSLFWNR